MAEKNANIVCPYCFDGVVTGDDCSACGQPVSVKSGIPSIIKNDTQDQCQKKLKSISKISEGSLDETIADIRRHYMDGSVVDRFFKTRSVNWRILTSSYLSGRGLVIGKHDENVGIILSEVFKNTYVVDTSLAKLSAQCAVARASGNQIHPIHSDLDSLPFPAESFDTIIIQCQSYEIERYLSKVSHLMSDRGYIILITNGWVRDTGITKFVNLGNSTIDLLDKIKSIGYGHHLGATHAIRNADFNPVDRYALLSTNIHENERGFSLQSSTALDYLLYGSNKTASTPRLMVARQISRIVRKTNLLKQCYPRYLFVCQPLTTENNKPINSDFLHNDILISGKNRSTVLRFDNNELEYVRKVPNSKRQSQLHKNEQAVINSASGTVSETIPHGTLQMTKLGLERIEQPVVGTPLDEMLKKNAKSFETYLEIVFDWLLEFQSNNVVEWIERSPKDVIDDLNIGSLRTNYTPLVEETFEIPLVISHGDFFGSNIYISNNKVSYVIDWEWADLKSNPMIDAAFFILQSADFVGTDFNDGFDKIFIENSEYKNIVNIQIERYCKKMNIEFETFVAYLSIGYINRVKGDMVYNKRLDIDWVSRINYIHKNIDNIIKSHE